MDRPEGSQVERKHLKSKWAVQVESAKPSVLLLSL